jgi:biopolymer transport protein ExbB
MKTAYMQLPTGLPDFKGDLMVGSAPDKEKFFAGEMDELQIVTRTFTDEWIRSLYACQGPEGNLIRFGEEMMWEGVGGMPIFYLATVFKNITLDGWMIIGCLIILGILSWLVMLTKGFFIYMADKDNRLFLSAYRKQKEVMGLNGNPQEYENSSLYRIYRSGCETLKQWIGNPTSSPEGLPPKKMASFKATLEKGLIDETKRLNTWMVILTMSISGGPFLGLLGTVWGVMNTFAAMAEAGEANLAAIAPGVASALSTTVFGLLVAIPALFGYNFLASKIRSITIDMSVFVDELGLKVDETSGRQS